MPVSILRLVLLLALARDAAALPGPVAFEPLAAELRGDEVLAVALEAGGERIAIGDAGGVLVGRSDERARRVLRRGPVHDLVFLRDADGDPGGLLAATERGLFRVDADGRFEALAPAPGEAARRVSRLTAAPGAVAAATEEGVFVSGDARRWRRLAGAVPSGPALAVALGAGRDAPELWALFGDELWRVGLRREPGPSRELAVGRASRVLLPAAVGGAAAVDLLLGAPGVPVAVLYPRALALASPDDAAWEITRPNLPPGAVALRLAFALGRWWLASDRGLLEAASPHGPWRRAAAPVGTAALHAVAGDAARVLAASARGLWVGRPRPSLPTRASAPPPTPEPGPDPEIRLVHRAALAYLDLQPSRLSALRAGLARRGWLPVLRLDLGMDRGDSRRVDFDETFSSGATRRLTDRDRSRSDDLGVGLDLSWDLGDTAYHPEAIDLSREARAVIALRDDVLDEITHAYFERRRVLGELAHLEDRTGPDAARLRLRAAELAAGIDAWTGGWFSRHAAPLPPP